MERPQSKTKSPHPLLPAPNLSGRCVVGCRAPFLSWLGLASVTARAAVWTAARSILRDGYRGTTLWGNELSTLGRKTGGFGLAVLAGREAAGLIVRAIGDRIAFTPRLIIDEREIAAMCNRFGRGLDAAWAGLRMTPGLAAE